MEKIKTSYLNEKPMKYVSGRAKGLSMLKAAKEAGYGKTGNVMQIENSKAVQEAAKTFKEVILKQWTKEEIVSIFQRNAEQDKDRGASNMAAKILMDKIEAPQEGPKEVNNKVLMIFR